MKQSKMMFLDGLALDLCYKFLNLDLYFHLPAGTISSVFIAVILQYLWYAGVTAFTLKNGFIRSFVANAYCYPCIVC